MSGIQDFDLDDLFRMAYWHQLLQEHKAVEGDTDHDKTFDKLHEAILEEIQQSS